MGATHSAGANRILIVDDDVDLLMLLERKLLKQGFDVETAVTLHEAEEILEYFQPQLLLLDINLNGEDGRKLSFKLKRSDRHSGIRIIILSGYDYSASRAVLFGADELITKPLHLDYLLHRIEHYLLNGSQRIYKEDSI
jgi:DNA-binding response OmpR family regulator